jgi:hypothetical protein
MKGGQSSLELYYFPPNLDETPLPQHLQQKLLGSNIHVKVWENKFLSSPGVFAYRTRQVKIMAGTSPMEFVLAVNIDATVDQLLELVLARKARSSNTSVEKSKDYVLKVQNWFSFLLSCLLACS